MNYRPENIDEHKINEAISILLQQAISLTVDQFTGIILTELMPLYTIAPENRQRFQELILSVGTYLARPDAQHKISGTKLKFFATLLVQCKPDQIERAEYVDLRTKTCVTRNYCIVYAS